MHVLASRLRRAAALALLTVAVAATCVSTPHAAGRTFMWKATGRVGSIYMVGSVHMLTGDFYPLNPALDAAFKTSTLLVEEADLGEMLSPVSQLSMLSRGMLTGGQSLEKILSPATYALVSKRVEEMGLPIEPLALFKPWALALTLSALEWQKAGFDAELGLDKHFYDLAQAAGKPVQGLETTDYQISLFDGMAMDQQDRMLAQTLKGLDTEKANVTKLAEAWKAGDAAAIERVLVADMKNDPQMYQRLLVDRNRNWLPKIEALLARPGTAFVVVGAAHMVGPDGLLAMLRAKGYSLEQM